MFRGSLHYLSLCFDIPLILFIMRLSSIYPTIIPVPAQLYLYRRSHLLSQCTYIHRYTCTLVSKWPLFKDQILFIMPQSWASRHPPVKGLISISFSIVITVSFHCHIVFIFFSHLFHTFILSGEFLEAFHYNFRLRSCFAPGPILYRYLY